MVGGQGGAEGSVGLSSRRTCSCLPLSRKRGRCARQRGRGRSFKSIRLKQQSGPYLLAQGGGMHNVPWYPPAPIAMSFSCWPSLPI